MKDLKDRGDRDGAYARSWDLFRMFRAMAVLFEIRYRRVPWVKKRETKSINTASIQLYSLAMAGFEHRELDVTVLSWSRIESLWRAQEKFYQGLQYEPLFCFVSAKYKRLHADIWRVCLPTASKSKACNAKKCQDNKRQNASNMLHSMMLSICICYETAVSRYLLKVMPGLGARMAAKNMCQSSWRIKRKR